METLRKQKTEIRVANDKKQYLVQRERRLWWLLMGAILLSFFMGILNGFYTLGGWEVIVPIMTSGRRWGMRNVGMRCGGMWGCGVGKRGDAVWEKVGVRCGGGV